MYCFVYHFSSILSDIFTAFNLILYLTHVNTCNLAILGKVSYICLYNQHLLLLNSAFWTHSNWVANSCSSYNNTLSQVFREGIRFWFRSPTYAISNSGLNFNNLSHLFSSWTVWIVNSDPLDTFALTISKYSLHKFKKPK